MFYLAFWSNPIVSKKSWLLSTAGGRTAFKVVNIVDRLAATEAAAGALQALADHLAFEMQLIRDQVSIFAWEQHNIDFSR